MLVALPSVDRACEVVCRQFIGKLDFLVLTMLTATETRSGQDGVVTRAPLAESNMRERIGVNACVLKASLARLQLYGIVVSVSKAASSTADPGAEETGSLWGVNSETMADSIVYKLNAMTPKKPPPKHRHVMYICPKCKRRATEMEVADSMNETCTAFLCTDPCCNGEMYEDLMPEDDAEDALYAVRGYLQGLCTGIQRALVLSRLDA
jgi:transcription initiation factor IIE alpha subunit